MGEPSDDRTAMAKAMGWASRAMTISAEMVLPGLLGVWIDQKLNTKVLFTLVGFATGLTAAIWHLLRMARSQAKKSQASRTGAKTSDRHRN